MRIDILMATYNGAKYIRQQILSIIAQTHADWRLLVHDDGSTDETVSIVREFASKDHRIFYCDDGIAQLGPGDNFMHLLQYAEAPFVCFCDQDDVWFDCKLEILLAAIASKDNTKPQVVYSNAYDWYPLRRNLIGRASTPFYCYKAKDAFFINGGIQGCASIFNMEMKNFINRKHAYVAMHDQVLMFAGIICNGIEYIKEPLFLYRQHEVNFTPHQAQGFIERIKLIIKNYRVPVVNLKYYQGISSFLQTYTTVMKQSDKKLFETYLTLPELGVFHRFYLILKYRYSFNKSTVLLLLKMMMRRYIGEL